MTSKRSIQMSRPPENACSCVDFERATGSDGSVGDDTCIRAAIPTIRLLIEQGARTVLCSHLGRPEGRQDPALSLRPIAEHLSGLLRRPVGFVEDCVGPVAGYGGGEDAAG